MNTNDFNELTHVLYSLNAYARYMDEGSKKVESDWLRLLADRIENVINNNR